MKSSPVLLFRTDLDTENEKETARAHLPVFVYRSEIPKRKIVFGRYSVLPYYRELYSEISTRFSLLVNTPEEHEYIADCQQWAEGSLIGLTPAVYDRWDTLPEGAYVVKGRTNSRKQSWNTRMFAQDRAAVVQVARRLYDDALLFDQGLVCRPYVPLRKLGEGLNGLPISNEWRCFFLRVAGKEKASVVLLAHGFYWASHPELAAIASFPQKARDLAMQAATQFCPHAAFFVLDLAETATGEWIVIEANDGCMSGLACIPPAQFYAALATHAPNVADADGVRLDHVFSRSFSPY